MSSAWRIEFTKHAEKALLKINKTNAARIIRKLEEIVASGEPRSTGKALKGKDFKNLWRYRVGDYRVLCNIEDDQLVVLVVEIGHRRAVYR